MKTRLKKIILCLIIFIVALTFLETVSFAEDISTGSYKTSLEYGDASYIFSKGGLLLKILRNIAAIVSVLTLTIIGLRYMVGSVEQKAEYKQTMLPVVIGCMLIASLSAILTIIQAIVN